MTTVKTRENVIDLIAENRARIRAFGVRELGLFGSFVREEQNEESDIDVLVTFELEQKTFDNFVQLSFFLEELFGRPVELVTRESLSPYIGPRILHEVRHVPLDD